MADLRTVDSSTIFISADRVEAVKVGVLGLIIGLLAPAIAWLLSRYLVEPVFCQSTDAFAICANGGNFAYNITTIVLALVGIGALVRLRVFRPLLIAVATAAALWGLKKYLDPLSLNPIEYYLWFGGLYAAGYLLFYWLLRLRSFFISFVLLVAVVVLSQWLLIAT